jgi:hypothetical protein
VGEQEGLFKPVRVNVGMSKSVTHNSTDYLFRLTQDVATRKGVDPVALQPINDFIDPDALDALIQSADERLTIQFSYVGYTVTVSGDGSVRVTE